MGNISKNKKIIESKVISIFENSEIRKEGKEDIKERTLRRVI